ncbi:hypothetical protein Hypma_007429 [Hypsizygus marmoreus]|uniref:Sld7 C-terminal domain-containing protein n=1 Tax=Hypsizygus marmoreus TaxID=39966 RepID=A0A369JX80_HYPMA|nr:hypothetical protein Hypma_007429 [Hypsizygus marmoreus]
MTGALPSISFTNPTPPRPAELPTSAYRLLYRGALSLPDSHLLLDGLTFAARLDSPSKHNHLLQNPLALALESMRGRPSLRFMGAVKLDDDNLWLDESGGIEMDIHPRATLTRIYFENIFCLMPFASTSKSISTSPLPSGTSDVGIKVSLGDTDGPDTTQVVIFARHTSTPNVNHGGGKKLDLIVARLTPHPPPAKQPPLLRLPRPDDPTPRKPPLTFGVGAGAKRELKRVASIGPNFSGRDLKRVASSSNVTTPAKRKKLVNGSAIAADFGSGVRVGDGKTATKGDGIFKVPDVPLMLGKSKGKGKVRQMDDDLFGGMEIEMSGHRRQTVILPGKKRQNTDEDGIDQGEEVVEIERANKNLIKRSTLDHLYKTKDPTTAKANKSHPEFKDLFGWVYRGVCFALRAQIKVQPVDVARVDQLVEMHVKMYVGGHGGVAIPSQVRDGLDSGPS